MNNLSKRFEENGYVYVKNFIDIVIIETISMYFENKIRRGEWILNSNGDTVSKYSYYGDPLIEVILKNSLDYVSMICGKELSPTYSYSRIYQEGESLKKHVDRPACEVSVTVNVASIGQNSPIWMQYRNNKETFFILNPGDAIIYKGCEAVHWRDVLGPDQLNVQFMLHYVDKNGPHSIYEFDKRSNLGFNVSRRN